jgi:hypothetical protein
VHYQECSRYAGKCCRDSGLGEDSTVGPGLKSLLSVVNYGARYAGDGSPAQQEHSVYTSPFSLPKRVTPYLTPATRFPDGSKGGQREDDGRQAASVLATERKYAGRTHFRRRTRANYPWSDLKGGTSYASSTIQPGRAGSDFSADIRALLDVVKADISLQLRFHPLSLSKPRRGGATGKKGGTWNGRLLARGDAASGFQ